MTFAAWPPIVTPVTVSDALNVALMTSLALASDEEFALSDDSVPGVTVGAAVSIVTVPVTGVTVVLPAASVAEIDTPARPVSPACTV